MSARRRASNILSRLWARWKAFGHALANVQARVLLTAFYFLMLPPFALVVRLFTDPLALREPRGRSYWRPRPAPEPPAMTAGRQY